MIKKSFLFLLIYFVLVGCRSFSEEEPTQSEPAIERPTSEVVMPEREEEPVVPSPTTVRLYNDSGRDFERVLVSWVGRDQAVDYGPLAAGEFSEYVPTDLAYRYGYIEVISDGETFTFQPIDYVGETPLDEGKHTYVLDLVGTAEVWLSHLQDEPVDLNSELVELPFYWVAGQMATGEVVWPASFDGNLPQLTLTETADSSGFRLTGHTGCNFFGGRYQTTADYTLVVWGDLEITEQDCGEEVRVAERFLMETLPNVIFYEQRGDFFTLRTYNNAQLTFTTNEPTFPAPFDRDSEAAVAPLLQMIDEIAFVRPVADSEMANASAWTLDIFDEMVQLFVFDDEASMMETLMVTTLPPHWVTGRYLLLYDGDYSLIGDVLDEGLNANVSELLESPTDESTPQDETPPVSIRTLPPSAGVTVPPAGLIYQDSAETLWRLDETGEPIKIPVSPFVSFNPQQTYAVELPTPRDGKRLPQLVVTHLVDSSRTTIELDVTFIPEVRQAVWLDETRMIMGVFDDDEDFGPNAGHPAIIDILTGEVTLLDSVNKMTTPAAMGNGRVYYAITGPAPRLFVWQEGSVTEWDNTPFIKAGVVANDSSLFSPAIAPDGKQAWWAKIDGREASQLIVYNPDSQSVQILLDIAVPPMGGFPPAAVWNEDGSWLVVEAWAREVEEAGVWLLSADGSQIYHLGTETYAPVWIGPQTVAYLSGTEGDATAHTFWFVGDSLYTLDMGDVEVVDLTHMASEIRLTVDETTLMQPFALVESMAVSDHPRYPDAWQGQRYNASAIDPPTPAFEEVWLNVSRSSPDGAWTTEAWSMLPSSANAEEHAQIFTLSDESDTYTTYALVEAFEPWGIGVGIYDVLRWTDEALYFTYDPIPGGCGLFVNSSDLWRYSFASQMVEQLLPELGIVSDLSPDGALWAGIWNSDQLQVVDVATAMVNWYEIPSDLETAIISDVSWSPDGERLLVTVRSVDCGMSPMTNQLFLIDWVAGTVQLVKQIESVPLQVVGWRDNSTAVLQGNQESVKRIITFE